MTLLWMELQSSLLLKFRCHSLQPTTLSNLRSGLGEAMATAAARRRSRWWWQRAGKGKGTGKGGKGKGSPIPKAIKDLGGSAVDPDS